MQRAQGKARQITIDASDAAASPASRKPGQSSSPSAPADAERHKLIDSCQGLVRSLAWKIHRKITQRIELEDLIAYGEMGLAQAAADFDAARGFKFTTYAHFRIRGAIFDGLSKMSWFSRHEYHRSKYEQLADDLLQLEAEDADESFGASVDDDVRWLGRMSGSLAVVYLAAGEGRGEEALGSGEPGPPELSAAAELRRTLRDLIHQLPSEAGDLIRLTYYQGLTLSEAGERLGISKAWASRLHARTLEKLAQMLRKAGVAD